MRIIAVANQKGGVGKTTTAVNLATALAELEKKTLLIDLDPQANATSGLGFSPDTVGASIYPALIGQSPVQEQLRTTQYPFLSLIPSEIDLAGCEVEIAQLENPLGRLREVIDPLRHDPAFDFVVVDCPPSLGILMTSALAAADGLIIPVQCEFFALEGISKILGLIDKIKAQGLNPNLEVIGVLMTMYDARTKLSEQVLNDVQQHLPEKIFRTIIPRTVRLAEAPSHGIPILAYDSSGVGSKSYRALAKEFLERVEKLEARTG